MAERTPFDPDTPSERGAETDPYLPRYDETGEPGSASPSDEVIDGRNESGPADDGDYVAATDDGTADDPADDGTAASEAAGGPPRSRRPRTTAKPRTRWQLVGLTALGVVAALLLGWFTGIVAGKAFGPDEPEPRATPSETSEPAPATGEGATPGEPITVTGATLFDPPPGDGEENPDRVDLSYDGQPGTTWPTLQYQGNAKLGNIKPGVGIIYDLGSEKTFSKVQISTTIPGSTVEVRTGTGTTGTLEDFTGIVAAELQTNTEIPVPEGTSSQYVLIWITELVPQQGYFQASLSEVVFVA